MEKIMNDDKLEKHVEFETKYRTEPDKLHQFISIVQEIDQPHEFVYAQGPDFYYTLPDLSFARYRKAENDKKAWVTFKEKPEGASNNIYRTEVNWRVDNTKKETIFKGLELQGYKYNFSIWKMCHIYKFKDATLVFYTVRDYVDNSLDHFIEIEVDEETIHNLTREEAMGVIRKYEEFLTPLGITYRNRLNKSLFEMYFRKIYEDNPSKSEGIVGNTVVGSK